jgi:hypothetical protein
MFQDMLKTKRAVYSPEQQKELDARNAQIKALSDKAGINVGLTPDVFQEELKARYVDLQNMLGRDDSVANLQKTINDYEAAPLKQDYSSGIAFMSSLAGMPEIAKALPKVESAEEKSQMLGKLKSLLAGETSDDVKSFIDFSKQQQIEQMIDPSKFVQPDPQPTIIEKTVMMGAKPESKGRGGGGADPSKLIKDKAYLELRSARTFRDKLTQYKKLFEESLQSGLGPRNPKYKGRLESLGVDLKGKYRQDSGWGAPQEAEFREVSKLIDDVSSWNPATMGWFEAGGGTDAFIQKLDALDQGIETNVGKLIGDLKIGYPGLDKEIQDAYGLVGDIYKVNKAKKDGGKKSGGLSDAEKAELEALKKELGEK